MVLCLVFKDPAKRDYGMTLGTAQHFVKVQDFDKVLKKKPAAKQTQTIVMLESSSLF